MTTALIVIDVQEAIFQGHTPVADWPERIAQMQNLITRARAQGAPLIFVQHDGAPNSRLAPGTPGWAIDACLGVQPNDVVVRKTECDSFYQTMLLQTLADKKVSDLIICGCWTNYCVDTTCRRAVSLGYSVQLAADAHACGDSDVLSAAQIIAHHNSILDGLSAGPAVLQVLPAAQVQFH